MNNIPVKEFGGWKSVELWFVVGITDTAFVNKDVAEAAARALFPNENAHERYQRIHFRTYLPAEAVS